MAAEFSLSCHLKSDPESVRARVMQPALFFHVAAPLVVAKDIGERAIGETWIEGEYRIAMRLFGLVPIGWQAIVVDLSGSADGEAALRDRGYGPMLREWDHRILLKEAEDGGTTYTDSLRLDAGVLTPLTAFFVRLFFRHRQRRLVALDGAGFGPLDEIPKA